MDHKDMTVMAEKGNVGDCFRACIASIIGRETECVPHFALLGEDHFITTAIAWLNFHGYEADMDRDGFLDSWRVLPKHIIRGVSPRGISHAVVGDTETGEMLHDPHPSRAGLTKINSRLYIFEKTPNA